MRLSLRAAGLASIFLLAIPSGFAKPPASSQGGQGSVDRVQGNGGYAFAQALVQDFGGGVVG